MEIFFTDAKALALPIQEGVDLDMTRTEAIARQFVPDGMPFVLNPDGSYHSVLNRFLRSLPVSGACSPSAVGGPTPTTWSPGHGSSTNAGTAADYSKPIGPI